LDTTTNNNQVFYFQASWDRLEMKPHEPKKKEKKEPKKRGEQRAIINQIKKKRKNNKTLSQKVKKGGKNLTKENKKKEPKIKVLTHELLAFTLSYLMLAPW
jgi:hypothetical protein